MYCIIASSEVVVFHRVFGANCYCLTYDIFRSNFCRIFALHWSGKEILLHPHNIYRFNLTLSTHARELFLCVCHMRRFKGFKCSAFLIIDPNSEK